eukprot:Em0025g95a
MDHSVPRATIPSFSPFDSTSELWSDYWARFQTFVNANSIPADKVAQVFLTNQTTVTYKLLSNMAVQQLPPKTINELDIDAIAAYMRIQFDPTRTKIGVDEGPSDGVDEGPSDGVDEGPSDGVDEGPSDGVDEGPSDGVDEGPSDGVDEGPSDGVDEGPSDGVDEGPSDGVDEGPSDGVDEGPSDGVDEGPSDGVDEGPSDGVDEGPSDGVDEGPSDGVDEGPSDGVDEGPSDGVDEGPSDGVDEGPSGGVNDSVNEGPSDGVDERPSGGVNDESSDGVDEGPSDGVDEGPSDGVDEGPSDGVDDGSSDGVDERPSDGPSDESDSSSVDDTDLAAGAILVPDFKNNPDQDDIFATPWEKEHYLKYFPRQTRPSDRHSPFKRTLIRQIVKELEPSTRMILMGTKKSRFVGPIGIIKQLQKVNANWPLENLLDVAYEIEYYLMGLESDVFFASIQFEQANRMARDYYCCIDADL